MLLNSSMMITTFLLFLILLHVSGNVYGPRLLTSQVGGSVTIKCYYLTTTTNKHDRKYWCKESGSEHFRNCRTLISTTDFIHEEYKTRVSMKDIPQKGILLVTMRQLKKNDTGTYRCGIGKNNNIGLYFGMNLNIWEGGQDPNLFKSPEMFWGKVSGSVAIKCSSEDHKSNERKFLCKLRRTSCSLVNPNRFVFTAEDSSGNFEVFIYRLRKEDSGIYKCGTGTPDNYSSARTMQLQVTEESVFSNILSYAQAIYEPQTTSAPSQSYITTTNKSYKNSFSQTKPNLLSIVMPVLFVVLVLSATVIAVLIKVKRQKKYVPSDADAKNPEVAIESTEQKCPVEHPKEENRDSDDQGSAAGPSKETLDSNAYWLLGMPSVEESSEKD